MGVDDYKNQKVQFKSPPFLNWLLIIDYKATQQTKQVEKYMQIAELK